MVLVVPYASRHKHIAHLASTWLQSSGRLVTASKEQDTTCGNSRVSPVRHSKSWAAPDTTSWGYLPVGSWPPGQGPPVPTDGQAGLPGDVEVGGAVEVTQLHVCP